MKLHANKAIYRSFPRHNFNRFVFSHRVWLTVKVCNAKLIRTIFTYMTTLALHIYLLVWPRAVTIWFQTKSVKVTEQKRTSLWRQTDTAHEYSGHEIKYKLWIDSYKTPFRHFKRTNMKSQRVYSSSLCGMIPVVLLVLCFFTANATDIVYGLFKPQFHIFSPSPELNITIINWIRVQ